MRSSARRDMLQKARRAPCAPLLILILCCCVPARVLRARHYEALLVFATLRHAAYSADTPRYAGFRHMPLLPMLIVLE